MKILAIKGGGVRGLLAAKLGERLERRAPGWSDTAELLAGTSTGGILALGLAAGKTWKELRQLYQKHAKRIFAPVYPEVLARVGPYVGGNWSALPGLDELTPQSIYDQRGLREVLEEAFGDARLRDLRRDVLVPSFTMQGDKWRALWFTRQQDWSLKVVDVALATAAAPVYFPAHAGCFDGGIVANDPSVPALLHAMKCGGALRLLTDPPSVFTLGCGRARRPNGFVESVMDGGLLGPLAKSLDLMGDAHWELDPKLPCEIPLDGGSLDGQLGESLDELLETARSVKLGRTVEWLYGHEWALE